MKKIIENLKKVGLISLIPIAALSLLAFVLMLIAIILYGANCASEFNGGVVSKNTIGLGIGAIICIGLAFLVDIAALFLANTPKKAIIFSLSRIGNYAGFILSLGAFLYEILDEYSLLGTILYPIVSGAVGDPVSPVLIANYFSSLIMVFVGSIICLVTGIILRKKANKIPQEGSSTESEVVPNE